MPTAPPTSHQEDWPLHATISFSPAAHDVATHAALSAPLDGYTASKWRFRAPMAALKGPNREWHVYSMRLMGGTDCAESSLFCRLIASKQSQRGDIDRLCVRHGVAVPTVQHPRAAERV